MLLRRGGRSIVSQVVKLDNPTGKMDHMMRMKIAWVACVAGTLLCWHAAPALSASADTDMDAIAAPHPRPSGAHAAPRAAKPRLLETDGVEDPEARPLPHYRKPGPQAVAEEDSGSLVMNVAGKLALVLALILACAAAWKRFQGGLPAIGQAPSQPVRVTGTVPLGPQRFLHLISIGGRQLLLGSTPQSICLIGALDENASLIGVPGIDSLPPARRAASPGEDGALSDEDISLGGSTPEERFEELLLRLRDLEAGPEHEARTSRPGDGRRRPSESWVRTRDSLERSNDRDNHAPEYERWSESSHETPWGRARDEEEARFVGPTAGVVAEALAPGALFRSAGRGSRSGGDA
jgi:flagellar biosynthetic protein FliO